jgi:class 3 adenylate cyclase
VRELQCGERARQEVLHRVRRRHRAHLPHVCVTGRAERGVFGECGTALAGAPAAAPNTTATPVAERRICSVLFADLVGFTPLSESRDPEQVRELLSE